MTASAGRICVICGEDCAGQSRTKDPSGRYYHTRCYEEARSARQSRSEPAAKLPHVQEPSPLQIEDVPPVAPPTPPCPVCGQQLPHGAMLCVNCGHSPRSGTVQTKVNVKRKRAAAFRIDAVNATLLGVSGLLLALGIAAFIHPPVLLALFCAFVLTAVCWSLYFYVSAFRESFRTGLAVLFVPYYQFVFFFRSEDRILRRGVFVMLLGAVLLAGVTALHVEFETMFENDLAQPSESQRAGYLKRFADDP